MKNIPLDKVVSLVVLLCSMFTRWKELFGMYVREAYLQDSTSVKMSLKTESTDLNTKESYIKCSNNLSINFITHKYICFTRVRNV